MADSRPRRMSYIGALTGMIGMLVPDRKQSHITGQSNVARVQPKVGDAIFVWDMAWGKAGLHEGKVTAILPKAFTVLFKDGNEFNISKKPTTRVCWTLPRLARAAVVACGYTTGGVGPRRRIPIHTDL